MNNKLVAILGLFALVFVVSCGGDKKETASGGSETTASTSEGAIGVPECDEYVTKFKACIDDKVPEAARATFNQSFDQGLQAWKDAAKTEAGKASLAQGCKTALETAKQSMASFGCEW